MTSVLDEINKLANGLGKENPNLAHKFSDGLSYIDYFLQQERSDFIDTQGQALSYYLTKCSIQNVSKIAKSFSRVKNVNLTISQALSLADSCLKLAIGISKTTTTKSDIEDARKSAIQLARFIKMNSFLEEKYRDDDQPFELGSYVNDPFQLYENIKRSGEIKPINLALYTKANVINRHINNLLPPLDEILIELSDNLKKMSQVAPIIKRPNGNNSDLQCFCRIFNERLRWYSDKPYYSFISKIAAAIFKNSGISISADYVDKICQTQYHIPAEDD
ncbi:hypothetical protein [Marinicella rhabdoformis]|uniref:hypothetical protein n=1 Tax=Marinicella rhabdoformis TaxID=2580566 RepID=UPI0012AED8E8|nr:hypothetical protein [Marinicella rhabdoformis]